MGTKARRNFNVARDILITDENGDFHIVLASNANVQKQEIADIEAEHQIVNAFSFGPALVAALSGNGEPLGALWVFVVGLLVGAALAACVYKTLEKQ